MRKFLIVIISSIILAACGKSNVNKANDIIAHSTTYKSIGDVENLDSVFDYKDVYKLINMGRQETWRIDSILDANNHKISIPMRNMLLQRAVNAYKLKTMAINLHAEHELAGLNKDFVGFIGSKETEKGICDIYFDKDLTKVIGVEFEKN